MWGCSSRATRWASASKRRMNSGVGELGPDHLDGDLAADRRLERAVDDAEGSLADCSSSRYPRSGRPVTSSAGSCWRTCCSSRCSSARARGPSSLTRTPGRGGRPRARRPAGRSGRARSSGAPRGPRGAGRGRSGPRARGRARRDGRARARRRCAPRAPSPAAPRGGRCRRAATAGRRGPSRAGRARARRPREQLRAALRAGARPRTAASTSAAKRRTSISCARRAARTARPALQPSGAEPLAQPGDVGLQRRCGPRRRFVGPDRVDQPLGGDHRSRAAGDGRARRAASRRRERRPVVAFDLERSEHPELHLPTL